MRGHCSRSRKRPSGKPSGRAIALDDGRGIQGESPARLALLAVSPSPDWPFFSSLLTLVRGRRVLGSDAMVREDVSPS